MPTLARRHTDTCSPRCRTAKHRAGRRLPAEMIAAPRWVRWEAGTKRPLTVDGHPASSTNPATWSTHTTAAASRVGAGLGLVLAGDGIVCLDLDHCLVDGRPTERARRLLELAGPTYVEVSPSGDGLHIWGMGRVGRGRRLPGVEVYGTGRYITVTGRRWADSPPRLRDLGAVIDELVGATA